MRFSLILLSLMTMVWRSSAQPDTLFLQHFKETNEKLIIDVQPTNRFKQQHLIGAFNAPTKESLRMLCDTLDRNIPVFVYCRAGERSHAAVNLLIELGFVNVMEMKGGLETYLNGEAWNKIAPFLTSEK